MSIVLERARETALKIPPAVLDELTSRPVSKIMRRQTWPDHERAEHSPFEQALVMGTVTKEAYADLLVNVLPVYETLESRMVGLADDPIAGHIIRPELPRAEQIAADLAFYAGPDARETLEVLPVTTEYVDRIRTATPVQYVAHHYTRYLADLSGGIYIDAALTKAWGLELDGRRYYVFDQIPDADTFKGAYRAALDEMPLDADGKRQLIEEVLVAYEFNIEMVAILADKHTIKLPA